MGEFSARSQLDAKILHFQDTIKNWRKEKLTEPRGKRRKEESLWVKCLLNNLQKINMQIEKQGDAIH